MQTLDVTEATLNTIRVHTYNYITSMLTSVARLISIQFYDYYR